MTSPSSVSNIPVGNAWSDWRGEVVAIIRSEFRGVLDHIQEDDIDWDAWRPLYDQGRSAKAAVDHAFVRDV